MSLPVDCEDYAFTFQIGSSLVFFEGVYSCFHLHPVHSYHSRVWKTVFDVVTFTFFKPYDETSYGCLKTTFFRTSISATFVKAYRQRDLRKQSL